MRTTSGSGAQMNEEKLETAVCAALAAQRSGEPGWSLLDGSGSALLGRRSLSEAVLAEVFYEAVRRLNAEVLPDGYPLETALPLDQVLVKQQASAPLLERNRTAYFMLRTGFPAPRYNEAAQEVPGELLLRLVDWDDPGNNTFTVARQFAIQDDGRTKRIPDVVLFVNGLPFVVIELKSPVKKVTAELGATTALEEAANDLVVYREEYPDLFVWNQALAISNGDGARIAALGAETEDQYFHWKGASSELRDDEVELTSLLDGFLRPAVLLDIVHSFCFFTEVKEADGRRRLIKRLGKPHQVRAARKVVDNARRARTQVRETAGGKPGGVVWHTPGAGKSNEILFTAYGLLASPELNNPTVLVITDRTDLDDQFYEDTLLPAYSHHYFADIPSVRIQKATSSRRADELISAAEGGEIILVMVQKMRQAKDEAEVGVPIAALTERANIVALVDEAHRSNYNLEDGYAGVMRRKAPNTIFVAFTGTPIETAQRSTRAMFGAQLDHYGLTDSIADRVTVDVLYERRKLSVFVDEDQVEHAAEQWEERFGQNADWESDQVISSITRELLNHPERLARLAEDIVIHWEARHTERRGSKGLVAVVSREMAALLYDEIATLRPDWVSSDPKKGRVKVVYSHSPGKADELESADPIVKRVNELGAASKTNCDEWKKSLRRPLDELQLVILVNMWLTGFDAPPVDTMYLLKPMKGAALIQTTSRVNRYLPGKPDALVVDYCGLEVQFREAIAEYGTRDGSRYRSVAETAAVRHGEAISAMLDLLPQRLRDELQQAGGTASELQCLALMTRAAGKFVGDHLAAEARLSRRCPNSDPCSLCYFLHLARLAEGFRRSAGPKLGEPAPDEDFVMGVTAMLRQRIADDRDRLTVDDALEIIQENTRAAVTFGEAIVVTEDAEARTSLLDMVEETTGRRNRLPSLEMPGESGATATAELGWKEWFQAALSRLQAVPAPTERAGATDEAAPLVEIDREDDARVVVQRLVQLLIHAMNAPEDQVLAALDIALIELGATPTTGECLIGPADEPVRSWPEEVAALIEETGHPVSASDIFTRLKRKAPSEGVWPVGSLPDLQKALLLEVARPDSPLICSSPNSYGIRANHRPKLTWLEAAISVLPTDGTPIDTKQIVAAIRSRQLKDFTHAKTPEATVQAEFYRAIAKGDSRFGWVRKDGRKHFHRPHN